MENMLMAYNEPVAGPSKPDEPAPEDVPEQSKTKTKRSKAKGRGKNAASTVRTRAATRSPGTVHTSSGLHVVVYGINELSLQHSADRPSFQ